jgi:hypothetical protein
MEQQEFFKANGIDNENELVLLDDRFRDGSRHYYHEKTDKIYSRHILRTQNGTWYFASCMQFLADKHKNPEEYRQREEKAREETRKWFEDHRILRENAESKYDKLETIIARHCIGHINNTSVISLKKAFIEDLIKNQKFLALTIDDVWLSAIECEMQNLPTYDLEYVFTPKTHIREYDIMYDISDDGDLYISLNDVKSKIPKNNAFIIRYSAYTQIEFLRKKNDTWEPAYGMKFRALNFDGNLMKIIFANSIDEDNDYVFRDGMSCPCIGHLIMD